MVFWRKKKNQGAHDEEKRENKLLHPKGEPDIEPSTESDPDSGAAKRIAQSDTDVSELDDAPTPEHTLLDDAQEEKELSDHTEEGGWLSRLTQGLSKSSNKITKGLGDLITKKKLNQDTLDALEDLLIEADLGPQTAAKIIETFAKDRFGKDISEDEIRQALAETMADLLAPVAKPLEIKKPAGGPFVILVSGVNGVGKTTTIGKLAHNLKFKQGHKVMVAAGDTFRAAAVEQLAEWSKRVGCTFFARDIGTDAASVAYEAYQKAMEDGIDVLMIDTAGRLHNKKNLMEELGKIVRVLKKQDENLPHAALLVLDATTGQNAFSQLETFKEMIDITGLIVTKLDGSAKGGVLVGLADQFGVPVHTIGVGEQIEDMQPFCAREYAYSLMGIEA